MRTPGAAYRISTKPGRLGAIERVDCPTSTKRPQGRCYELIAGRRTPCVGCPAFALGAGRGTGIVEAASGEQILVTAERDGQSAEIRRVSLTRDEVDALVSDRFRRLAAAALLTQQETRVAARLVRGESVQLIADALGIAVRTVKFHQGRAFRKLKVSARYELAGLVVHAGPPDRSVS